MKRRTFLGGLLAAIASPLVAEVVPAGVGDGIALNSIPQPDMSHLLVKATERWVTSYNDPRGIWWVRSDGGVTINFLNDGSQLSLPSPAGEILRDARIRRRRDI